MLCIFRHEIRDLYPNKFIQLDDSRVYVLNTLFHLPGNFVFTVLRRIRKLSVKHDEIYLAFRNKHVFIFKTLY